MKFTARTFKVALVPLTTWALASGCSFSKNDKTSDDKGKNIIIQQVTPERDSLVESDFTANYKSKDTYAINDYTAHLEWKKDKKSKISIFVGKDSLKPSAVLDSQSESSFEIACPAGQTIVFRIVAYPYSSNTPTVDNVEKSVTCPLDQEISGTTPFSGTSYPKIGKIFFHKDSVLNLDGKDVDIKADAVIIDTYAKIESYDPTTILNRTTSSDMRAPIFKINADKLLLLGPSATSSVQLDIDLVGLDGQPGISGDFLENQDPTFAQQKNAAHQGTPGSPGISKDIPQTMISGPGGFGIGSQQIIYTYQCETPASNGGAGSNGIPGFKGGTGGDGMNTPFFELTFGDGFDPEIFDRLAININAKPGMGGGGGPGGRAIPPGKGGPGAPANGACPGSSPGRDGQPMEDGAHGDNGKDGTVTTPFIDPRITQVHTVNSQ